MKKTRKAPKARSAPATIVPPPQTQVAYRNRHTVGFNDPENELVIAICERKSIGVGTWLRMVAVEAARREPEGESGAR